MNLRAALVSALVVASAGGAIASFAAPAAAEGSCSEYSALAAADGVRVLSAFPGASPTDADGQSPAAQAQADSVAGSNGWAGAPFSNAAAGNAGAGGVDATQVPFWAISSYPSRPAASTSTPAASVQAKSDSHASAAEANAGPPPSDSATVSSADAKASAACADDGTITATASSIASAVDVGGVLRIASIRSIATAKVSGTGDVVLDGSVAVEGATVSGKSVAITDRGIVAGGSPTPLPGADPIEQALEAAGVHARVVPAVKDPRRGDVLAPTVEITVTRAVSGVGTGPSTTTYTFGRAFAHAAGVPGTDALAAADATAVDGGSGDAAMVPSPAASVSESISPSPAIALPAGPRRPSRPTVRVLPVQRIAQTSAASMYPALAIGALALAVAGLLFNRLGGVRWNSKASSG